MAVESAAPSPPEATEDVGLDSAGGATSPFLALFPGGPSKHPVRNQ